MFSYNYAPLVALVCGIISLIAMIVPMVLPAKNIGKMLGAVGLILAIVALILTALFYRTSITPCTASESTST